MSSLEEVVHTVKPTVIIGKYTVHINCAHIVHIPGFDFKTTFHKNPQLTTTYRQKAPIAQHVRRIDAQIAVRFCAICSIYIIPKALGDILTVSVLIGGCFFLFYSPSLCVPPFCHFAASIFVESRLEVIPPVLWTTGSPVIDGLCTLQILIQINVYDQRQYLHYYQVGQTKDSLHGLKATRSHPMWLRNCILFALLIINNVINPAT